MVKEAYQNEYNLHFLARVAKVTEKSQYNEYMCSECGELYTQAGYKVVQVPMTEANPPPPVATEEPAVVVKTEQPAVTQEPAGRAAKEKQQPVVT